MTFTSIGDPPGIVGREGTGRNHEMLPFEMDILFKYHEMEYAIKVERTAEVLQRLRSMVADNNLNINMPITLRFIRADNLWLSPTYRQDSCYFSLTMGGEGRLADRYEEYFRLSEKIFMEH